MQKFLLITDENYPRQITRQLITSWVKHVSIIVECATFGIYKKLS